MLKSGKRWQKQLCNISIKGEVIVLKKIKDILIRWRQFLENLRKKSPKSFDNFAKFWACLFTILSTFTPLLTIPRGVSVGILIIFFSGSYAFQWATLVNREERHLREFKVEAIKRNEATSKIHRKEINGLKKEYEIKLQDKDDFTRYCTKFSHKVSHDAKELSSVLTYKIDPVSNDRFTNFLKVSLNTLEKILTIYYGKDIRASIKLTLPEEDAFRTFGRGKQNILSRGGIARAEELYEDNIKIADNYAYQLLYIRKWQYFAAGDLHHLSKANKLRSNDCFYCEYGDEWPEMFNATLIMPIRFHTYTHQSPSARFDVLGLVCIDCYDTINEWSSPKVRDTIGYQIVADFADSLCGITKQYMQGGES